jgi:hypothetical protein
MIAGLLEAKNTVLSRVLDVRGELKEMEERPARRSQLRSRPDLLRQTLKRIADELGPALGNGAQ